MEALLGWCANVGLTGANYLYASLPDLVCREGRVMGIVEVSRSIGDGRFKHCGIISTPDILRCQLTVKDM